MRQHIYDPRDRKEPWKARSGDLQRLIIQNLQKFFWRSDPAQPEALLVEKTAHPISHATRKRTGRLLKDDVEGENISIVVGLLPKRSRKEQVLLLRSIATKKRTLSSPESKRIMTKKITQKVRSFLTIAKPPCCLMESRCKRRLRRAFRLSE